jgi:TetR/AcrR family transcriptional regulator, regulator of cefoperazone and chloramphenicol sensitivity
MGRKAKTVYENNTRLRLIDAAGSLFADKGFSETTIRDICDKAGANIAAVNYHFSGKMELYEAALEYALLKDEAKTESKKTPIRQSPQEKLHVVVLSMITNIRMSKKPEWFPRLLRREMLFPTAEFQEFSQRLIKEDFDKIHALIREIAPGANAYTLKATTFLLLGQIKSIAMESEPVLKLLFPELKLDLKSYKKIAQYISGTTIASLKAQTKAKKA